MKEGVRLSIKLIIAIMLATYQETQDNAKNCWEKALLLLRLLANIDLAWTRIDGLSLLSLPSKRTLHEWRYHTSPEDVGDRPKSAFCFFCFFGRGEHPQRPVFYSAVLHRQGVLFVAPNGSTWRETYETAGARFCALLFNVHVEDLVDPIRLIQSYEDWADEINEVARMMSMYHDFAVHDKMHFPEGSYDAIPVGREIIEQYWNSSSPEPLDGHLSRGLLIRRYAYSVVIVMSKHTFAIVDGVALPHYCSHVDAYTGLMRELNRVFPRQAAPVD